MANQRFDEAHELSGDLDESVDTNAQSMSMASPAARVKGGAAASGRHRGEQGDSPPRDDGSGVDRAGYPPDDVEIPKRDGGARVRGGMYAAPDDDEDDDEEEEEEETEDEASGAGAPVASMAASGAGGGTRHGAGALPPGGAAEGSGSKPPRGYDPAEYSHLKVSKVRAACAWRLLCARGSLGGTCRCLGSFELQPAAIGTGPASARALLRPCAAPLPR